jgi:phosphatidylinositol-3-phosphatase
MTIFSGRADAALRVEGARPGTRGAMRDWSCRSTAARLLATATVVVAGAITLVPTPGRAAAGFPPIKHIWIVVLENKGYAASFGASSYLASLAQQGALIPNYFGVAHQSLPNYIAMIGGQGPTPQTQSDCQAYSDVTPGSQASGNGHQAQGDGCVYPKDYPTVADQIGAAGLTWKGYMEDLGFDAARDAPMSCKSPSGGAFQDTTQKAEAQDGYAARHNPFLYYHTVLDSSACLANVVTLQSADRGLLHDLGTVATTPNYSFITPNLCNDGHDVPCVSGATDVAGDSSGGMTAITHWLQRYVPTITGSPAYKQDGMLVVTFDEADTSSGDTASAASCCHEPYAADGQPPGGYGPGGGQVGAVVLSPFVAPNTKTTNEYNHYSLLRTVEDVLHLGGGDDKPAAKGHVGLAADYFSGYTQASFGDDVFTNPSYVPPANLTVDTPMPAPGGDATSAGAGDTTSSGGLAGATSPYGAGTSRSGASASSTAFPPALAGASAPPLPGDNPAAGEAARWSPKFLTPAAGSGAGPGLYALVLIPLLAVGAAAAMMIRRRSGGAC